MAFKGRGFRGDRKKLFSGIMCIVFAGVFFWHAAVHGFTISKIVFGGLLLYFGIANLRLAR